ncbi:hypothetical protein GOODEAATRI_021094 [Goodea atripinnis]|uniref:Uncharacterized protein n=1 Tax=Goodea atripinnis TaxID=208336 RepID=A0ABV0NM10_9TELE
MLQQLTLTITRNKSPSEPDPNSIRTWQKVQSVPGKNLDQNLVQFFIRTRYKPVPEPGTNLYQNQVQTPSQPGRNFYQNQVQTPSEPGKKLHQNQKKKSV